MARERGEYADLQWLYHYMERSASVIYSVLQRRRAALLDCDWDIRLAAPVGEGAGSGVQGSGGEDINAEVQRREKRSTLRQHPDGAQERAGIAQVGALLRRVVACGGDQ